jgi:hypothetical protein
MFRRVGWAALFPSRAVAAGEVKNSTRGRFRRVTQYRCSTADTSLIAVPVAVGASAASR